MDYHPNMFDRYLKPLVLRVFQSRILRDSSALMISNWASTGMALATSVVLARRLGAENYGLIILAITVVSTIVNFLDIRTSEGLVKFMGSALARGEQREAITFFHIGLTADFTLMVITFAVVAIAGPLAANAYSKGEVLRQLATIYLWTIPFTTLQNSFGAVLTIFKRFRLRAIVSISSSLTLLVALVTLSTQGVRATMWGYVITAGVTFVLWVGLGSMLLLKNFDTFRGNNYRAAWQQFLPFAFHTSLTASIKSILVNVDILILGALRPPSELSFYKIARSATGLLSLPISPVQTVIFPEVTEAWAQHKLDRVRHLIKQFMLYGFTISGVGSAIFLVSADWLVQIVYGATFGPVANLIRIMLIGTIVANAMRWARPVMLSSGKPRYLTYSIVGPTLLRVLLLIALVPLFGVVGAAIAFDITMLSGALINLLWIMPALGLWRNPLSRELPAQTAR